MNFIFSYAKILNVFIQIYFESYLRYDYDYAKANGDNNVYIINGADTYAGEDRDSCLVDEIHPNDFGFYRYAKAVYNKLKEISEDFI